jgi:hypothetical protein
LDSYVPLPSGLDGSYDVTAVTGTSIYVTGTSVASIELDIEDTGVLEEFGFGGLSNLPHRMYRVFDTWTLAAGAHALTTAQMTQVRNFNGTGGFAPNQDQIEARNVWGTATRNGVIAVMATYNRLICGCPNTGCTNPGPGVGQHGRDPRNP